VLSLINNRRVLAAHVAVPTRLVQTMLQRRDTSAFGYQLIGERIYAVQSVLLRLVDSPMGTLTIGSPINDDVARSLGAAMVDAQVCFVAAGHCVASSAPGAQSAALAQRMAALPASGRKSVIAEAGGRTYAFVGDRLSTDPATRAWWVVAAPIDNVLRPFKTIDHAIRVA